MIKLSLSVVRAPVSCLLATLVVSCGSASPEGVQGTIINFDPPGVGQATTAGSSGSNYSRYRVEVRSPTGYPQLGVDVTLDSQYIVYAGRPVMDCSTIPCTAPGATPLSLPYTTTTGQNGYVEVTVVYSWNIAPVVSTEGDFTAIQGFSGTGYGNSNITFTCSDPNAAGTTPDCPT